MMINLCGRMQAQQKDLITLTTRASSQLKLESILSYLRGKGDTGATTREISDHCDLSVYSARNWLLKLEEKHYVILVSDSIRSSKWKIVN
jgi:response regulator of citrate/malate metabolism